MGITGRDTRASSGFKARCFLSPSGRGDKVSDDDNEETIVVSRLRDLFPSMLETFRRFFENYRHFSNAMSREHSSKVKI